MFIDKRDKEPISNIIFTCLYGMFVALFVCRYILIGSSLYNISFVEEVIKFLIVIVCYNSLSKSVNNFLDLIIYSCYSSLGFALAESLYYLYLNPSLSIAFSRSIYGFLHCIWISMTAYGFRLSIKRSNPIYTFIGLSIAVLLHTLHNYLVIYSFNIEYTFLFILELFGFLIMVNKEVYKEVSIIDNYRKNNKDSCLDNSQVLELYELELKNKYISSRLEQIYAFTKSFFK